MKIGIDIREALREKTGKGYYTLYLVSELLKKDTKNTYFLYSDTTISEDLKAADLLKNSDKVIYKTIQKNGMAWHISTLKNIYKEKIDVFFSPTSYIIPAIHNPKKLKVIMTVHDLVAFLFPAQHNKKAVFIENTFLKRAVKKTDGIIAVSSNTKQDLIIRFHCDPKKINVIYNASSPAFREIPNAECKTVSGHFILGVGTLEPRKNFETLIRTFAQIQKDFPDYTLVIAGGKGWYFDTIFETVRDLHLEKKVKFLGYVSEEELVNLYNLAQLFVYPSLYEGFGIPPLDAMRCGCPVITSDTSSLPEVVGEAALTVHPHDEKGLAETIKKVLKDESLRKNLCEKGFVQANKFSWEKSASQLLNILNNIEKN